MSSKLNNSTSKTKANNPTNKSTNSFKSAVDNNKINVMPSQKNMIQKESLVLQIEKKLYTYQQEKDQVIFLFYFIIFQVSSEFSKLPEFPKMKVQILKKKELELKMTNLGKLINNQKIELRELNAHNNNY